MSNAFVLGAGGTWGAFQAGALSVLLTKPEYSPNAIFGSSAGALNGAFLANLAGKSTGPPNWSVIGSELLEFWRRNVTSPRKLWEQRNARELAPDLLCGNNFRGLLATEKERTGFPFPNHPRPLFRDIVRGEISANNLKNALEEKKIRYCPATVDLFTGKIEYKEANDENIIDLVIASTAIPIAMDSVDITQKGEVHSFVDGGTRDVAPLSHAVRENYTNLACIVCQSPQVKELGEFQARKLASLMGRLMNIVINETVNNDLLQIDLIKGLLKRGAYLREELPPPLRVYFDLKCVTVIRPSVELELDDMNFTPTDIEDTIKLGINAATKLFKKPKVFATLAEATSQSEGSGSYILCW